MPHQITEKYNNRDIHCSALVCDDTLHMLTDGPLYTNRTEQNEEVTLKQILHMSTGKYERRMFKEKTVMTDSYMYDLFDMYENDTYEYNDTGNYEYNGTEPCDLGSTRKHEVIVPTYIYSLICVIGFVGNILVLLTFSLYKKAKTMTDIYLVNVAVADLLFVVALPLIIYNESHNWYMGTWACKLLTGTYSMNLFSSTLLLALISGDRYIAVVQARRSVHIRSQVQAYSRFICLIIWLLAFILSLPTLIFYGIFVDITTNECIPMFEKNDTAKLMKVLVPSTQMVIGFLLPLMVMIFCYSCIVVTLLKAQNFQRHKAVRVVLTVVFVFVFCHLPYNVALLVHTTKLFTPRNCEEEQDIMMTLSISRSVAYLHCCLNPILYAFIGVKFRSYFCQILRDLRCLGKRYIYPGRSSQQTSDLYISANKTVGGYENPSSFTM